MTDRKPSHTRPYSIVSDMIDQISEESEVRELIKELQDHKWCFECSDSVDDITSNLSSMLDACYKLQGQIAVAQGVVRRMLVQASEVQPLPEETETHSESLEDLAKAIGADRQLLLRRLLEARSMLKDEYRVKFRRYEYDFDMQSLVGADGYSLQWKLREKPDEPISYGNQQTSRGDVVLCKAK